MGIVLKQSLSNAVVTYLGFGIGAVNTLFLYTNFISDEYYGLVGVILSTSLILMPLFSFGVPLTLIKYYNAFTAKKELDAFLTLMLLLPILMLLPIGLVTYFFYDDIGSFLASENSMVKKYVWYIFFIGMALAYFEVFYAMTKARMKSVFGNFMKEIFVRLGVTVLLVLVYLSIIDVDFFLKALVGLYIARMLIMKIYAYRLHMPKLNFAFPKNSCAILSYTTLIILGGSSAVIQLEIDKFMINQYIEIQNVAYYSVAIYIATVVIVPSRAMHQITHPLTADILGKNDMVQLKKLYQKSSLTLLIISGLIFILILPNLADLYQLLPEEYRGGFVIVFLIGLVKVYDSLLGNNNAILYNSDYYKAVLFMGAFLAVLTVVFNLWLIPSYGIDGAAYATFLALFIYNTLKIFYVKVKFNMLPFTLETAKVFLLLIVVCGMFYFLELPFYPLINIGFKSILITGVYLFVIYKFKISDDVYGMLRKFFKKKP
ncbi:oligosaccharide flippase family protein [Costertonia aggregata]|uniref:Oligosaccharide flippase family protein n=1 Tax=Costertonia aggregata TaxID=343403 RepID=A0A7H9AUF4_9FLAO|nr:polysaccharide biosynthesis C-terminal domain-containing protein [Costertonia aggregata]QLG47123.1 oligosaccharide flippase family protein [Costertonia aggregata]